MSTIPTVLITHPKDPSGFLRINADRFRPGEHTLWNDRPQPQPKPLPTPLLDITQKTVAQARPLIRESQGIEQLLAWRSQEQSNDPPRSGVLDEIADQLKDLGYSEG